MGLLNYSYPIIVYRISFVNTYLSLHVNNELTPSIPIGGGGESRTLEGLRPTRFPSVRTRPLCDASFSAKFIIFKYLIPLFKLYTLFAIANILCNLYETKSMFQVEFIVYMTGFNKPYEFSNVIKFDYIFYFITTLK